MHVTGSRKEISETEYYAVIAELLEYEEVQELKHFRHHIRTNRFQHCLNVSYYQYKLCRFFGLDAESAARAGLLHDLYFYETKEYTKSKPPIRHSKHHPEIALENAEKLLVLNDKERDMIRNHMFPMTFVMPKYPETYLTTLVDKYCAVLEFILPKPEHSRKFSRHRRNAQKSLS